jgi:phage protein U
MLYMLGDVVFELQPTNLDTVNRERGQDWAAKAIVGAQKPREAMGVADAPVTLFGKLFPHRYGLGGLEALAAMAEGTAPQMLIRGDGTVLGWHCTERVKEKHSYLDNEGVGRVIDIEITLTQSPTGPGAGAMMSLLQGLF